ncbi:MAG: hypothetical protein AAGA92_10555 [Planctomycetota bacterium]
MISHLRSVAFLLAVALATIAPVFGQTAYYSLEGNFTASSNQVNLPFNLSSPVSSSETLRFQTYANAGGVNAAGNTIVTGGIDSLLVLAENGPSSNILGSNFDWDTVSNGGDSLLSWANVPLPNPQGANTPINPDPLPAGNYRVNLQSESSASTGPWALDLLAPASAFTLNHGFNIGSDLVDSLDFGTVVQSSSPAVVDIDNNSFNLTGDLTIAGRGNATLNLRNGALVSVENVFLAPGIGFGSAKLNVTGQSGSNQPSPSRLTVRNTMSTGERSDVRVEAGGRIDVNTLIIGGFTSAVTVTGVGADGTASTLSSMNTIDVGSNENSILTVTAGGRVEAAGIRAGFGNDRFSQIIINGTDPNGNASTVELTGGLTLAGDQAQQLIQVVNGGQLISNGGTFETTGNGAGADVQVSGVDGSNNPARWTNSGNLLLGSEGAANGSHELLVGTGGLVETAGDATVKFGGEISIQGGTLQIAGRTNVTGGAVNMTGGVLRFGTTTATDYQAFTATGGTLAGLVEINADRAFSTLNPLIAMTNVDTSGVTVLNQSYVFGAGTFGAGGFINTSTGELEVITGERMRFGGSSENAGEINNFGGQVRFAGSLVNQATGSVSGRGQFIAGGGWTNEGSFEFSGGFSDVLGDVENKAGGSIISSGGGTATFFDDVLNAGTMRASSGATIAVFGAYSGNGVEGPGLVNLEGTVSPGFSPGTSSFGGNLQLGDAASLLIELAGPNAGSGYDQVTVAGDLTLDGQLLVSLLDGFTPGLNQMFDIATVNGVLIGEFEGLGEGASVGIFGGAELFITYAAGDGNDVALFTAIPEPTSLALLALGGLTFLNGSLARRPRLSALTVG